MPKKPSAGAKKPRWTSSQKAAKAQGAKKSHHRGQPDGPSRTKAPRSERSPRWDREAPSDRSARPERSERPDRRDSRDARVTSDRGGYQRRDDRGSSAPRRDDRAGARGGYQGRDDRSESRGGYQGRDQRSDSRGDSRGERPAYGQRRDDRSDSRGGYQGRDQRSDSRGDSRGERPAYGQRRDDRSESRGYQGRDTRGERPAHGQRRDDRGSRPAYGERREGRPPFRRDSDTPARRVADPVRRDRHEGRHFDEHRHDLEQPRTFEEAEAERAQADTWVKYESKKGTGPATVTEDNGFARLGVDPRLVERLARDGITTPFPIQDATIPDALAGRDVLGRGQTGSGKTLAFGLPTITRLVDGTKPASKRPRSLIMVPTRELAMQVSDALEPLVHVTGLRHKLVAGGLSYEPQVKALAKGIDILVATPGRLADLIERGAVELDDVQVAILDEADHMADMGFLPEVTAILDKVPAGGQRLLFSATLDKGIDTLVDRYLTDPVTHSTEDVTASVTTMSHHIMLIDPNNKKQLTAELAARDGRTVVFVRTQLGADRIARELREKGVLAAAIHGGLSQNLRNRALGAFRDGSLPVLVATDVAARGIHVDDIGLVLQADPPADHKDYLHRAGRTARAGEKGTVVTFALPHQKRTMERLAEAAGLDVAPIRVRPGDEHVAAAGGRTPSMVPVADEVWKPLLEAKQPQRGHRPGGPPRRFQGASRGHQGSSGGRQGGERRGPGGRAEWKRDR
ncbi:DEAD/DEAH box helicase [Knoellia sp. Soil729]|uniref:DEAD/DEAH box helicase n=1 Tax=Knoellia sp. Soil729 TaxID=1736394 RepID=UPI0006F8FE82|nr:DEAD/DEAH box helicase [Knoellia sp. Soil729]KRE43601.1 DEAD/DEAH box helicase [Knoellia sp. Soil729]